MVILQEFSIFRSSVELPLSNIALMECTVKACYLIFCSCGLLAILNTEGVQAVSDHYALNYHRIFFPTAHHAALALIRGTYLRLTHTVHLKPTFGG